MDAEILDKSNDKARDQLEDGLQGLGILLEQNPKAKYLQQEEAMPTLDDLQHSLKTTLTQLQKNLHQDSKISYADIGFPNPQPRSYYVQKAIALLSGIERLVETMQADKQGQFPDQEHFDALQKQVKSLKGIYNFDPRELSAQYKQGSVDNFADGMGIVREIYLTRHPEAQIASAKEQVLMTHALQSAFICSDIYMQTLARAVKSPVHVSDEPVFEEEDVPEAAAPARSTPQKTIATTYVPKPISKHERPILGYPEAKIEAIARDMISVIAPYQNRREHQENLSLLRPQPAKEVFSSSAFYEECIRDVADRIDSNSPWQKDLAHQLFSDASAKAAGELLYPAFSDTSADKESGRHGFAKANLRKLKQRLPHHPTCDAFECLKLIAANEDILRAAISTDTLGKKIEEIKGLSHLFAKHPKYEEAFLQLSEKQLTQNMELVEHFKENALAVIIGVGSDDHMSVAASRVISKLANGLPLDRDSFPSIASDMLGVSGVQR